MLFGYGLTIDCADPEREARFWAAVMGHREVNAPGADAGDDADAWREIRDPDGKLPVIFFQHVPEPNVAKNRVHLDLNVGGEPRRTGRRASTPRSLAGDTGVLGQKRCKRLLIDRTMPSMACAPPARMFADRRSVPEKPQSSKAFADVGAAP